MTLIAQGADAENLLKKMHLIHLKMHTTRHYCGARDYAAVSFTSEHDKLRIMGYFHTKCR